MFRSYLFAPGHKVDVVGKACASAADAVILDLEDAVPDREKHVAREVVAAALAASDRPIWVRVNAARSEECELDLKAVGGLATRIRVPKVESIDDLAWVAERAPGVELTAALETALGLARALDIATSSSCHAIGIGGMDLRRDLMLGPGETPLLYARSSLVIASRAAGLPPPVDSVYAQLDDEDGLRREAEHARTLGFFGKAAVHPRQLAVIHDVFTPSAQDVAWAREVLDVFEAAQGGPAVATGGEFVDLPVARRAQALLDLHEQIAAP
jgi:citrate lyase subunit beta/citryl-CoA lyase